MKRFIKEYFSFSSRERNGVIVLIIIIILQLIGIRLIPFLADNKKPNSNIADFRDKIASFKASIKKKENVEKERYYYKSRWETKSYKKKKVSYNDYEPDSLFNFDPNKINFRQWKTLGLSEKLINIILNYRKKGGRFYQAEDVKKIYGFPDKLYDKLKKYININNEEDFDDKPEVKKQIRVELNSANVDSLKKLYGIGRTYAQRIIKFRDLLGGYVNKRQLKEVYGLRDSTYLLIKEKVYVDKSKVKRINLRIANFDQIMSHPYIDYKMAKEISKQKGRKLNYLYKKGLCDSLKCKYLSDYLIYE